MDGWVFAIGDQRTDVFGKGEVKRHGNNGGSEGVAANHQHSGGDAADERKWIHGRGRKSGSTLARPMTLQWVGLPPPAEHVTDQQPRATSKQGHLQAFQILVTHASAEGQCS